MTGANGGIQREEVKKKRNVVKQKPKGTGNVEAYYGENIDSTAARQHWERCERARNEYSRTGNSFMN